MIFEVGEKRLRIEEWEGVAYLQVDMGLGNWRSLAWVDADQRVWVCPEADMPKGFTCGKWKEI